MRTTLGQRRVTQHRLFGPNGAAGCCHGWSAVQPVEEVVLSGPAPAGQRNYWIERQFSQSHGEPRRLSEIVNHSETLMVIEVAQNLAVHWMSPFDAGEQMVMGLGTNSNLAHDQGTHAAFVDGFVRFVTKDTSASGLRDWISITGNRN